MTLDTMAAAAARGSSALTARAAVSVWDGTGSTVALETMWSAQLSQVHKAGDIEQYPAQMRAAYAHGRHVRGSAVITGVAVADRAGFRISDAEVEELARHALIIEEYHGRPLDNEWGEGRAIGQKIGAGPVRVMTATDQIDQLPSGDVRPADMTDPDWEPIMELASAIVTTRGDRTCHTSIIARELGIPAVEGSGNATHVLVDAQEVTEFCAEDDIGSVYQGIPRALQELETLESPLRDEIAERISACASPREYFVRRVAEGVSILGAAFAPEPVIVLIPDTVVETWLSLSSGAQTDATVLTRWTV